MLCPRPWPRAFSLHFSSPASSLQPPAPSPQVPARSPHPSSQPQVPSPQPLAPSPQHVSWFHGGRAGVRSDFIILLPCLCHRALKRRSEKLSGEVAPGGTATWDIYLLFHGRKREDQEDPCMNTDMCRLGLVGAPSTKLPTQAQKSKTSPPPLTLILTTF